MPAGKRGFRVIAVLLVLCVACASLGQATHARPPASTPTPAPGTIALTVVDENGLAVAQVQVTVERPGQSSLHLVTDYTGRCFWSAPVSGSYAIQVAKPGFYENRQKDIDPSEKNLRVVLTHEQLVQQQVSVTASAPGIDPEQVSDRSTMNVPEIVNVPYPTNNDIRNLLPFTPGVVQDATGQVHVAGGETYMTLDTLDGFDMRSPVYGTLDMRVSADAVRSLDVESTRYPVEYGRATGGVIAFSTGMGDNKFRYDATNFIPSFRNQNGIRFDTMEPRLTVSGPLVRNRAWFFDAIEMQYSDIFVPELPPNADTDHLAREGNLMKYQVNIGHANSLTTALLFNDYHSPYEGISALTPQQSSTNHDAAAWLPYARDQQSFRNGVVLDTGFGVMRYREGYEPHGTIPYDLTPELPSGSFFANTTTRSQRLEGYENVYLPPRRRAGSHQIRFGVDLDHLGFTENLSLAPIYYLREDRTLERESVFPAFAPFSRHNVEVGSYIEDRWSAPHGLLIEPGLRFDWDEIIRRPLLAPRIAVNYSPPGRENSTKLSAGIGEYYEHTELEYLTRALAGIRYDTDYAADGITPTSPPEETQFIADDSSLREAHAWNWSVGAEQKFPDRIYVKADFLQKRLSDEFVYAGPNDSSALYGTWVLTNNRQDHYHSEEIEARRSFGTWYTLFASFTHSSAKTNAALDYVPTLSILGPQQGGPLFWDVPNRLLSWGWLPAWAPFLPTVHKNWDFVYTLDMHSGFPYDSINANQQIVGPAGSRRFPRYVNFSPGLEWRFHFRGKYFGLRGTVINSTDTPDPYIVNNNVDSPQYGTFLQPLGRAFTTRIRLIESSK
ncbi:MAG: carboxypeptidase regulatory-like domain-containing protein [Acidobacteriaceae bacterium]